MPLDDCIVQIWKCVIICPLRPLVHFSELFLPPHNYFDSVLDNLVMQYIFLRIWVCYLRKSNVSMINNYYLLGVQKTFYFYPLHRQSILIHYKPCFGSSFLVQSFEGRMQNLWKKLCSFQIQIFIKDTSLMIWESQYPSCPEPLWRNPLPKWSYQQNQPHSCLTSGGHLILVAGLPQELSSLCCYF